MPRSTRRSPRPKRGASSPPRGGWRPTSPRRRSSRPWSAATTTSTESWSGTLASSWNSRKPGGTFGGFLRRAGHDPVRDLGRLVRHHGSDGLRQPRAWSVRHGRRLCADHRDLALRRALSARTRARLRFCRSRQRGPRAAPVFEALHGERSRAGALHHRADLHLGRRGTLRLRNAAAAGGAARLSEGPVCAPRPRFSGLPGIHHRLQLGDGGALVVRRRAHALGCHGARDGGQPRHGAVGGNRHQAPVHAHLRARQRARWTRRRPRRGDHRDPAHLSVREPRVFSGRGGGGRLGQPARAVRGGTPDRHRRHGLQVLAAAIRRFPDLCRHHRHPAVAASRPVRETRMSAHAGGYSADPRIRWIESLPWIVAIAAFFALPEYLSLGARILIYILYALSLDLIVGYAGIITLGHSAYFGLGAYVAGILAAKAGIGDPMVQLVAAAAAGALLAITTVLLEIANKATALTGGADGLSGVVVAPVLGLFRFDIFGKTAYLYCLLVLLLGWWLVRKMIYSPFGTSLTGVRENSLRMHAIGAPVYWRLVLVYTLSATIAGVAGGLITQTNQFVGLNVLSFESAGELLVMLILGGVGRIYGAFVGPVVYLIAQDLLAKQFPEYWYFGIGTMLVLVVMFARGGILGILDGMLANLRRKP